MVKERDWTHRTWRLYVIRYATQGWIKIGVEAAHKPKRVAKWQGCGGDLIWDITLSPAEREEWGRALYDTESTALTYLRGTYGAPSREEYQLVAPDMDGLTETFVVANEDIPEIVNKILEEWIHRISAQQG